jgi:hypothetical protein
MLLSLLTRKEKLKFLDLAMHMVSVDGEPTAMEQRLLNMMLAEVGDGIVSEYHFSLSKNLPETIDFFNQASPAVKNIAYLNLLKVAMSDDFYNSIFGHLMLQIHLLMLQLTLSLKYVLQHVLDFFDHVQWF